MKTIALRFGEQFSPECGTIAAHQQLINEQGHVWYGKKGAPVSAHIIHELKEQEDTKILLISSGKMDCYWAHTVEITSKNPPKKEIPEYYRDNAGCFNTWFKVKEFEPVPKTILSKCIVVSSGKELGGLAKQSMSPYFIIECTENEVN